MLYEKILKRGNACETLKRGFKGNVENRDKTSFFYTTTFPGTSLLQVTVGRDGKESTLGSRLALSHSKGAQFHFILNLYVCT